MPLSELKKMQVMRGKPVNFNSDEEAMRAVNIVLSKHANKNLDIDIEALKEDFGDLLELFKSPKSGKDSSNPVVRATSSAPVSQPPPQLVPAPPPVQGPQEPPAEPPAPAVPKPDLVTSTVVVPPRMLRLKGELLSILFILPTKRLRWRTSTGMPAEIEAEQASIIAAGEHAAQNVLNGAAKLRAMKQASLPKESDTAESTLERMEVEEEDMVMMEVEGLSVDISASNIQRLAEKAAEKARRNLSRQFGLERFIRDVQQATSPRQLLLLAGLLEDAIPAEYLFAYNKSGSDHLPMLPSSLSDNSASNAATGGVPVTIAEAAKKIYTLDRSICYDELKGDDGFDSAACACPYRMRTQFVPRCILNPRCKNFLCHNSRCVYLFDTQNASRVPDGHDMFVAQAVAPPAATAAAAAPPGMQFPAGAPRPAGVPYPSQHHQQQMQQQQQYQFQYQYQRNDLSLAEVIKRMVSEKREIDIEAVVPYLPGNFEITTFEWV